MPGDIGLRYNATLFANNDTPRRIVLKIVGGNLESKLQQRE
jgi:hypothetical protein